MKLSHIETQIQLYTLTTSPRILINSLRYGFINFTFNLYGRLDDGEKIISL